jgi:hypothetical protein
MMRWNIEPRNRVTEAIVRVNENGEADEPISGHDLNWHVDYGKVLVVRDSDIGVATFDAWEYIVSTKRSEDSTEIEETQNDNMVHL